jgi:hypothetical protein
VDSWPPVELGLGTQVLSLALFRPSQVVVNSWQLKLLGLLLVVRLLARMLQSR